MNLFKFMYLKQTKEKSLENIGMQISKFNEKKYCIPKRHRLFEPISFGSFNIKIADTKDEIKSAQYLRYSVFYKEKQAQPNLTQKLLRRDFDSYDQISDHLIVIDNNKSNNNVVGTYRLFRGSNLRHNHNFYSEKEFDITNIKKIFSYESILELGRSCVHRRYRSGLILKLLWIGLSKYIDIYKIKALIGCASFSGIDIYKISKQLVFLNREYSLPKQLFIKSRQSNIEFSKNDYNHFDKNIFNNLPPLIKGYLRAGGMVSKEYFVDQKFNTIDVFILLLTEKIRNKYKNKFYNKK